MIQKKEQLVVTFNTTTDAIRCEKYCAEQKIEGRIIPVPRVLSASCGMAFKAPLSEEPAISDAINRGEIISSGKYRLFI